MLLIACGGEDKEPAAALEAHRVHAAQVRGETVTSALTAATPRTPDADALMDWAERDYPTLFPSHRPTLAFDPYVFRHYPDTGNYIGVAGTKVYLLGPVAGGGADPVYMGERSTFSCLVYPVDCNTPPVAQIATLPSGLLVGQALELDGSSSRDPDGQATLSHRWTLTTRPSGSLATLGRADQARASLQPDRAGRYVVTLVVNDGLTDSPEATTSFDVAVPNLAPVAATASSERLFLGTDVQLDGSASHDPEGRPLQYLWTLSARPAGSNAALTGASSARPRLMPDVTGTYAARLVVSDGQLSSAAATVEMTVVPVPAHGLLIDPRRHLASRQAMESLLGGPLFGAWNPTQAGGSGMKIMMFGAADTACPSGVQGTLGAFDDAVLATIGYTGAAASVPADMRFEAKSTVCGTAAANKRGPSRVFSDGSSIWLSTATLGAADDLLRPFKTSGQNNTGGNVNILNTSVNYKATSPMPQVKPWSGGATARLAVSTAVAQLQTSGGSTLNQAKQQMAVGLHNTACSVQFPGRLCQMQWLFALAISQSDVSDWSTVGWAQGAYAFGDIVQGNMPIIDVTLLPATGQVGRHRVTGAPFFTSRGSATQHTPFDRRSFAVDIDFEQFKAALRVASAQMFGEPVLQDAACSQCERLFGAEWANPEAWALIELQSMQEVYDTTGRSARVTGSFDWLYVGPAP